MGNSLRGSQAKNVRWIAGTATVAEREELDTIFTLDGDFRIYRIDGGRAFQIVP